MSDDALHDLREQYDALGSRYLELLHLQARRRYDPSIETEIHQNRERRATLHRQIVAATVTVTRPSGDTSA